MEPKIITFYKIAQNFHFLSKFHKFQVHIGPLPVERPEEISSIEAPRISRAPQQSRIEVNQDDPVHIELRVLPANDTKMQVEWLKDGAPLAAASRFRPMFDFGYIALDILYAYPEVSLKIF